MLRNITAQEWETWSALRQRTYQLTHPRWASLPRLWLHLYCTQLRDGGRIFRPRISVGRGTHIEPD